MKLLGNRKSKKKKLSLKYNIQKRIREHKRRVKKEAKKLGLKKRVRKDPGIPNSLPWKGELLADIEAKKAKREEALTQKKQEARDRVKQERQQKLKQQEEMSKAKETERRQKRETERRQKGAPLDVVRHLLDHVGAQALMRHYRLPGFEGAEGFVQAWAKTCNIKTKKGKMPGVESAAQLFLLQLAATPPAQLEGDQRQQLEAVMKAQLELLRSRDAPAVRGLLKDLMEGADEDNDDDESDDGFEEGEEEELEGEEEEEEEDDDMQD
ncbi:unnamed protein product [Effrenium voratum]|uniref:Guanine nucleotide-binding protein-like 3 N-terminal domain-containing protein n=1 Tax=Effrenium voratum TaxID=2562239 RepID=A0AA36NKQ8_9DINO|nr:unnamed protein product [Effrenium voratum]CAJ1408111.1 unnamed protein product [Effrenium voratum]CAJ1442219.1 unnamed protein product [Effrenium voratum]